MERIPKLESAQKVDPGEENSLDLNVKITKKMLTDFRKAPNVISDLFTDGVKVERVTEYKYL